MRRGAHLLLEHDDEGAVLLALDGLDAPELAEIEIRVGRDAELHSQLLVLVGHVFDLELRAHRATWSVELAKRYVSAYILFVDVVRELLDLAIANMQRLLQIANFIRSIFKARHSCTYDYITNSKIAHRYKYTAAKCVEKSVDHHNQ